MFLASRSKITHSQSSYPYPSLGPRALVLDDSRRHYPGSKIHSNLSYVSSPGRSRHLPFQRLCQPKQGSATTAPCWLVRCQLASMFIGAFLNELFLQQFDAVALHLSFPHTTWLIGVPTFLPSCGMYRVADHPWFRMYARKSWMQLASKGRSKVPCANIIPGSCHVTRTHTSSVVSSSCGIYHFKHRTVRHLAVVYHIYWYTIDCGCHKLQTCLAYTECLSSSRKLFASG
ncbi:hypothetical protein V8E55_002619 [Tylopilus felleus]